MSERKLAAIMFTDIVGYSALTQRNEALALRLLEQHNEITRGVLSKYDGVEVKTIGDSFLVEFKSALAAIECAYELQKALHEYNEKSNEKLLVRIGIHIGDVVHKGNDVFGDAVNIASRIESFAEGGGVCISEQVYAQVRNKTLHRIVRLEPRQLKNITFPVGIYRIVMPWDENTGVDSEMQLDMRRLAVLPFANVSPDPNDEYFSDGLTDELISKLSLMKGLKVIARTSSMRFKGKGKSVAEIGRELGAGTIVEGSVRKAGNRIRVTVQVVNANSEEHLWSSSYDNNLDNIFAVQSEIATKVSDSLPAYVVLPSTEKPAPQYSQDTRNVTAYTYYLKATQLLNDRTEDSLREALELFTNATKLDPSFARAYVGVGKCYYELGLRNMISVEESDAGEKSSAAKALEIDPNLAEAHSLLSLNAWGEDNFEKAESEAMRALELNPNLAEVQFSLATLKLTLGYPMTSLKLLETAYALDPLSGHVVRYLGLTLAWIGKDSEALNLWGRTVRVAPFDTHLALMEHSLGKRDYERAQEEIRALEETAPSDFRTLSLRALLQAMTGDRQGAEETLVRLGGTFARGALLDRTSGYVKFLLGDMDGFFEAMFRAAEAHILDPFRMRYSPIFEGARGDPRYRQLFERLGLDPELREAI
ncbi:MAG TPA: adenylate/guanylate cyclase domain-containing protein [Nitrososphaerales archaeon]|nr:adenylate/guanylate cyclase domain-containing protein [Nitrososphaerales archaeon]